MCIIAIKPAGVAKPTAEQFKAMCDNNPNGFGYMTWNKDKGLQVRKTMDKQKYLKWVENIPDKQPVVYHMRIATHGSVQEKNCHPFIEPTKQWAFAHNGILSIKNEGDMTDSETFFKRIALPFIYAGIKPKSKAFDKMITSIIGSSKFVFLNSNGQLFHYGQFIKEKGLLFSNSTYEPRKVYTYGGSLCGNSGPYGGRYWHDDYDDYPYTRRTLFSPVQPAQQAQDEEKDEPHTICDELSDYEFEELCDYLVGLSYETYELRIKGPISYITQLCKYKFPNVTEDIVTDALDFCGINVVECKPALAAAF